MRKNILLLVTMVTVLVASMSQAVPLILHDTGEYLTPGQPDLNWTVEYDGNIMNPVSGVDYNGAWVIPAPPATWISVIQSGDVTPGLYKYSTTFRIGSGYDPTTAEISGYWWSDYPYDSNAIYLNGIKVSDFNGAPWYDGNSANAAFTINDGANFISGLNTLTFWVSNDGGPSGTLVQGLRGSVSTISDGGSTIVLLGCATGLLGAWRRRLHR